MLLVLHGAAGGWDEIAVAVVGLAVLWIAVKLAGRKAASDEDDEDTASSDVLVQADEEARDPAHASRSQPR